MPDVVAKAMAVITGLLLAMTCAILVITSRPPSGTREVVAEFQDAFPTLEGFQVRVDGAPAGSVGKIRVTKTGLASITLLVNKDIPAPKSDATATIKQLDSTGDSYILYNPGSGSQDLAKQDGKPTIKCNAPSATDPCRNTLNAPRLDDLTNAFGPPEQAGIKLILQSLSEAVDQRGGDVNRAALTLVPALTNANKALAEVNSQNTALKAMISNLEDVTGQAASKRVELGNLIGALDHTLQTTAAKTRPLDAALAALPATQADLRRLLVALTSAANETRPFAAQVSAAAPALSSLLDKAPGFIEDVRFAIRTGLPTLELTRKLLIAAGPTIAADPQRLVTGAFDLAPALSNLLKGILGGDDTIKAFFGDDKNGAAESRPGYGFGLGAAAAEPGNEIGYPDSFKTRNQLRVSAVISCQSFGIPVKPGCLTGLLAARAAADKAKTKSTDTPAQSKPDAAKPAATPELNLPKVTDKVPQIKNEIQGTVDQLGGVVDGVLGKVLKGSATPTPPSKDGKDSGTVGDLLDFLVGG